MVGVVHGEYQKYLRNLEKDVWLYVSKLSFHAKHPHLFGPSLATLACERINFVVPVVPVDLPPSEKSGCRIFVGSKFKTATNKKDFDMIK